MTMCAAGREVPGQGVITHQLVLEGAWGEVWEAEHNQLGKVLFVAYATDLGARMFAESQRALERWNDAAQSSHTLLRILKIETGAAVPYLLAEHPGLPNLAVRMANTDKVIDPEFCIRAGVELAEALNLITGMNLGPAGICPHTLFYGGTPAKPKMRILPVAPTSRLQRHLGDGRFIAPEVDTAGSLEILRPDTYSLVWMVTEMLAGGPVERTGEALRVALPMERLGVDLAAVCLPGGGAYMEINTVEMMLKRYLRSDDTEKDFARLRKQAEKEGKRVGATPQKGGKPKAPGRSATPGRAGAMAGALLLLFVKIAAVVAILVALGYGVMKLVVTEDSDKSPAGVSRLFVKALVIDQNLAGAEQYTAGQAGESARQFLDILQTVERENLAGRPATAMPILERTESSLFLSSSEVVDDRGTTIFIIQMEIYPRGDGRYAVTSLGWTGTAERTIGF